MESWKNIDGYDGLYKISNLGRVKSSPNKSNHNGEMILKQSDVMGYRCVCLYKNSVAKMFKVHRLVATAFLENTENKPQVNHIDGNKLNNNANNLEWVTASENTKHAHEKGLAKALKGKDNNRIVLVVQINKETNREIKTYYGIREAERETGVYHSNISRCCKGIVKSAGGFKWEYKRNTSD